MVGPGIRHDKKPTPATIRAVRPGITAVEILNTGEWSLVNLFKSTSGIVVVGTQTDIKATADGGGISLPTSTSYQLFLAPGTSLYAVGSTADQVVAYSIQPVDILVNAFLGRPSLPGVTEMPAPGTAEFQLFLAAQSARKGGQQ